MAVLPLPPLPAEASLRAPRFGRDTGSLLLLSEPVSPSGEVRLATWVFFHEAGLHVHRPPQGQVLSPRGGLRGQEVGWWAPLVGGEEGWGQLRGISWFAARLSLLRVWGALGSVPRGPRGGGRHEGRAREVSAALSQKASVESSGCRGGAGAGQFSCFMVQGGRLGGNAGFPQKAQNGAPRLTQRTSGAGPRAPSLPLTHRLSGRDARYHGSHTTCLQRSCVSWNSA